MFDQTSILPPNRTQLEASLDVAIRNTKPDVSDIAQLLNSATCPEALLPWLAWALSVDDWNSDWPEETKRSAVAASVTIHRHKGTISSVRNALKAYGYGEAAIVESYAASRYDGTISFNGVEDHGEPDHWAEYRVYLERPITIDQADQLKNILNNVAPARCRLKGLFFTQAAHRYNAAISFDGSYSHGVVE